MAPNFVKAARYAALLIAVLATPSARAEDSSPWVRGATARARLVASGGLAEETYNAGVEIELVGAAHTYWRQSGDAGAPPVFSFADSTNLAQATVLYPAPDRLDEGGLSAIGYRDDVIFPLAIAPRDPARPVVLALDLRYAACDRICVPLEAKLRLELTPAAGPTAQVARIAVFAARVPTSGGLVLRATPDGAQAWRVSADAALPAAADLFVDPPPGWWFETRRVGDGFALTLAQKPDDAPASVAVPVTLTLPDRAFDTVLRLDVTR